MRKKLLSLFLVLTMTAGLLVLPAGASGSSQESTERADKLNALHLFRGTANGYQLDGVPTRLHGLIMLIRLLGQEDAALACEEPSPFTDTDSPYVAYAYANGLTRGTSATTFTPNSPLSAPSYVTFLLRALGYDDSRGDFAVGKQLAFAANIGMITEDAAIQLPAISMNRGDMVDLSYAALFCAVKEQTLAEKLLAEGVFTEAEGQSAGVLDPANRWVYSYAANTPAPAPMPAPDPTPVAGAAGVSYETRSVSTSGGTISAHVLTVDTKNPKVTVKTAMVNNTLGATAPFKQIVESSGAYAAVNGNFFNSYDAFKTPIGHVMVDGEFLYGSSGISSLGITRDGTLRIGRPALFTRLTSNGVEWAAYEINTANTAGSVLFTPAYGSSVSMPNSGHAMTVAGGTITGYQAVSAGTVLGIPSNGAVLFMDGEYTSTNYFREPVAGSSVSMEYYLFREDPEGFNLDNVVSIVSGAPRLVQDGSIVTELESGFQEARFTTASSPRTAVGVDSQGRLVLVSVSSATIQQMREAMLSLGCVDAFNLDGGASCGMYHNGSYIATPGRELTVTLQVFVEQ